MAHSSPFVRPAAIVLAGILAPIAHTHQSEKIKLLASDGAAGDQFGFALQMDVDTLVVGAPLADGAGADSGAVYVYVVSGTTWVEQAKLVPSAISAGDNYGYSVSISENVIVVGAPQHDGTNGVDSGSVFIWERSGTVWTEAGHVEASDGLAGGQFGLSIAVSGTSFLVGAPEVNKIYAFSKHAGAWTENAILTGSDTALGDQFGFVAIDGNTAIVGAPSHDAAGFNSGAAYVFERSLVAPWNWSEQAKLTPIGAAANDAFGFSVAILGNQVLVGAPSVDAAANTQDVGAAYEFQRSGTTWTEVEKHVHYSPTANDRFGNSVAIAGPKLLVGSITDEENASHSGGPTNSGSTHELYCLPNQPAPPFPCFDVLIASDAQVDDMLGISVTGTNCWYALGSLDDDNGTDAGAVYTYLLSRHWTFCTAKTNSCGTTPKITHTGEASVSSTSGFTIRGLSANEGKLGLLLYSDAGRREPAIPFQGGFLCINAPIARSIAVIASGGTPGLCDSTFSIDMDAFSSGNLGGNPKPFLLDPSTIVVCQFWGRDTVHNGSYLTEAWEYKICP